MKRSLVFALGWLMLMVPAANLAAGDTQNFTELGAATVSLEDEKDLSRRAVDMWASGNSDKPQEIFAKTYVNRQEPNAEGGVKALSLEEWEELVRGYHKAFSNSKVLILVQIAEGHLVATRWQFTATQTGQYMGLAPSGKEVTWTGVQIDRFDNGKIVESWVNWDKYRLFEGLGLVK
jgi:predicted ester cyclase